ncbi:MAG: hypothetical protein AB1705_15165 [Verrucomicrobiota bacterium]
MAVSLALFLLVRGQPGTVSYHLANYKMLRRQLTISRNPSQLKDYLRGETMRWYLRGKPTVVEDAEALREAKTALLQLGYFHQRDVYLTNRVMQGTW